MAKSLRFFTIVLVLLAIVSTLEAKEVKLLNIGNSFSWSLSPTLNDLVKAEGKHTLIHKHCSMPGCEMHRHWSYVENFEKNGVRDYTWEAADGDKPAVMISMQEALQKEKWDVVTVQQASHESWRPECYQPWGGQIVALIHKLAPQARIAVQQTWAYRADSPRFPEWKIDQQTMYERLTAAYKKFAREEGDLPLIPVGDAVQLARQTQDRKFVSCPPEEAKKCVYPATPDDSGAFINSLIWGGEQPDGSHARYFDYIHLNGRGCYLQALVWYGFLFGEDPVDVKYVKPGVDADDAAFLRKVASEILKATPKFN